MRIEAGLVIGDRYRLLSLVGAGPYLTHYLVAGGPYFLLIFFCVSVVRFPAWTPLLVRFPIIFTVYSLIFVARMNGIFLPWSDRAYFTMALFGVGP